YVELSYNWGDPTVTINIKVNGKEIGVTVSLEAALQRLRAAGSYVVWADALCINQMDKQEKSLQIPRIGAVFRKAYGVAIWLGDE
ncbi:heterokaryon incompatibility, partial [Lasiosphaeria miniovina]